MRVKTPEPALSIILVNYNGGLFLQVCLDAVRERTRDMEVEVVVVDNGSTDGSPEAAAAAFLWSKPWHPVFQRLSPRPEHFPKSEEMRLFISSRRCRGDGRRSQQAL